MEEIGVRNWGQSPIFPCCPVVEFQNPSKFNKYINLRQISTLIDLNRLFYFFCCNFNNISTNFFVLNALGYQQDCPQFFLRTGVAFFVDVEELFQVEVSVLLSRGQTLVPQKLLDHSQVRSPAQEVGGE
jgi:hypothetical protein